MGILKLITAYKIEKFSLTAMVLIFVLFIIFIGYKIIQNSNSKLH